MRQTASGMRRLLGPFVILAGAGSIVLYIVPGATETHFAWTLVPEPSATFMGAGFGAGVVLTLLSYRRQPWVVARTASLTIFVFVSVMTVATFLHIDRLHLDSEVATARLAAWIWLAVYTVVAPTLAALIILQERLPGVDPPRNALMPRPLRLCLIAMGIVFLATGIGLAGWPVAMDAAWPWAITAFSGRALAAWIIAIGFAAVWVTIENDLARVRPASVTFTVLGGLWFAGMIRASGDIRWERASTWIYLAVTLAAVAIGAYGWSIAASSQRHDADQAG